MHIRTFRAPNLHAALADIRRQMGPAASVLHTRQVRDGWMGWLGRTQVEVTAGMRDETSVANLSIEPRVAQGGETDQGGAGRLDVRHWSADPNAQLSLYRGDHDLPATLRAYEKELQILGVDEATARSWIEETAGFAGDWDGDSLSHPWVEQLQQTVARGLRLAGPIRVQPGERHVVALIGPTGVGKTTTIAKLAAGFRLESRRRVGLLTIDTFRIAAVQQLKAYAEIMDLPMEVVETRDQMRAALDRLGDVDLVLIDTAGRSPRSDARIEQLTRLLREAQPDETHLVVSATSSPQAVANVCEGFAPVGANSLILTKMDETPHTCGVLSAIQQYPSAGPGGRGGLPVSYLTNGQQVPDDIVVANTDALVQRLLPPHASAEHLEAA